MVNRGAYRHLVAVQNPGPLVADGIGGFTEAWLPDPAVADWWVSMQPAGAREGVTAGSVQASAAHLVQGDYRADITMRSRVVFNGRAFYVTQAQNLDELNITWSLTCEERVS